MNKFNSFLLIFLIGTGIQILSAQSMGKILMFVSYVDTYSTEYVVMREALEAAGYEVDVRSSHPGNFSIYTLGYDNLPQVANDLPGSSYADFQEQFLNLFGESWDESNNELIVSAPVDGIVQDLSDMLDYEALVIVGGTGALDYRVDGTYEAQGEVTAEEVQAAAEKLNDLAIDALLAGKPVLAQCHGASIPAFFRIPDTSTGGGDLGTTLLEGSDATGYPETETCPTLEALGVVCREDNRVMVSSPNDALSDMGSGDYRIITTRDWYLQTVAYAARTLINVIETYPTPTEISKPVSVLVIHGGALDDSNVPTSCSPANRVNDIPCNHGIGDNLPADYTYVMDLLAYTGDGITINATALNVANELLPSDLSGYDAVIFFKHWSTNITDEILQTLVNYTDGGGGLFTIHHGLYNDQDGGQNKNILVEQIFGAESVLSGWAPSLTNYNLYNTAYGHVISTYGINYGDHVSEPNWSGNPLPEMANRAFSNLPYFSVYDELYSNFRFTGDIPLGRGINEITPLFSNAITPSEQFHTSGFTGLVDKNQDGQIGKILCLQFGERRENYDPESVTGRIYRNGILWLSLKEDSESSGGGEELLSANSSDTKLIGYPNPVVDGYFEIKSSENLLLRLVNLSGEVLRSGYTNQQIDIADLPSNLYLIQIGEGGTTSMLKLIKQ